MKGLGLWLACAFQKMLHPLTPRESHSLWQIHCYLFILLQETCLARQGLCPWALSSPQGLQSLGHTGPTGLTQGQPRGRAVPARPGRGGTALSPLSLNAWGWPAASGETGKVAGKADCRVGCGGRLAVGRDPADYPDTMSSSTKAVPGCSDGKVSQWGKWRGRR